MQGVPINTVEYATTDKKDCPPYKSYQPHPSIQRIAEPTQSILQPLRSRTPTFSRHLVMRNFTVKHY